MFFEDDMNTMGVGSDDTTPHMPAEEAAETHDMPAEEAAEETHDMPASEDSAAM